MTLSQGGLSAADLKDVNNTLYGGGFVDMGNSNYTMTRDEAVAGVKIITNEGTGNTLTYPMSAIDGASTTAYFMQFATNNITLAYEGGGATATLIAGNAYQCLVLTSGAFIVSEYP